MNDESALCQKAREAIEAGKIPSGIPQRTWGGPGTGACCTICGVPIEKHELEIELEFSQHAYLHIQCLMAWESERHDYQPAQGQSAVPYEMFRGMPQSMSVPPMNILSGARDDGTMPGRECNGTHRRGPV